MRPERAWGPTLISRRRHEPYADTTCGAPAPIDFVIKTAIMRHRYIFGVKRRNVGPFSEFRLLNWPIARGYTKYDDAEAMKWIDLSQQYATEILRFLATVSA